MYLSLLRVYFKVKVYFRVTWSTVPFKSKLTVCCKSRFLTWLAILYSCANRESRIENKLSRIALRIESRRTENKRFTHDWFLDNFSKTYSCNTTRHGYICSNDCMLERRPGQVIKQMFLQGNLYQASFPQLKFQILAPNANKQCISCVQATACLFCKVNSGLILPLGLIKISCNIHVRP